MPTAFTHSLRSLEADGSRRSLWALLLFAGLAAMGLAWLCCARVTLYEISAQARLEVEQAPHPVASQVPGRIKTSQMALGRKVAEGTILLQLDDEREMLRLGQEQAHFLTLTNRLVALRQQIHFEELAWPDEKRTAALAAEEASARLGEAEAAAKFAEGEFARLKTLSEGGLLSQSDRLRGQAEAEKLRAAASALTITVAKLESEAKSKERAHEVRLARLRQEIVSLEGDLSAAAVMLRQCVHEIERCKILAPVAGEIGEVAELRPGAVLTEGQKIGAIIPGSGLKVVAQFSPGTGLGRLRAGQPARLRLAGFSWAQYGTIPSRISRVALEPRDGMIRVESFVNTSSEERIPLQHGLPGVLEVEVEKISPAWLILRTAGSFLSCSGAAPSRAEISQASP